MKLSKDLIKKHDQACRLLEKDKLTVDERIYVLENWHEGATHMNSKHGAFFTPNDLARDFQFTVHSDSTVIDLCAGIGALSFYLYQENTNFFTQPSTTQITCVEINPKYVEVGKKILPEANWIVGSILDEKLIKSLGTFKQAISNPPFGNIQTDSNVDLKYKGADFELKTIEIASMIAEFGAFILPQGSTPYQYSGFNGMNNLTGTDREPTKVKSFKKATGLEFEFNIGIDTSCYKSQWRGVSPIVELIAFEFGEILKAKAA